MKEKNPKREVELEIIKVADISETFGKLKREVSGQKFKDIVRSGW